MTIKKGQKLEYETDGDVITVCEVCGGILPVPILDLGYQPLCDDLVPLGDSKESMKYPIQISLCPICLTAHQLYRVHKEILFPNSYHYRPRFTQDVMMGMNDLVCECENCFLPLSGKLVCDIGCNDGTLLSFFRQRGSGTVGMEPTDACVDAVASGHRAFKEYFSTESAAKLISAVGKPDVITFTNVFAHIESLAEAIAALQTMINTHTLLVIENHYLGSIIHTNQFDTFYHEHPRTYSLRSFEIIARKLGGEVLHVSFPGRYGGNIRVYIGNFSGSNSFQRQPFDEQVSSNETRFPEKLLQMQTFVNEWKQKTTEQLMDLKKGSVSLPGKSFPGRASILINLLGIDHELQPYVFEKPESMKVGHYVPGTRIRIVSDDHWINGTTKPDNLLIWAWHICGEVASYLRSNGYRGRMFSPLPVFHEIDQTERNGNIHSYRDQPSDVTNPGGF